MPATPYPAISSIDQWGAQQKAWLDENIGLRKIAQTTLSGNAASFDFDLIPATYKHLKLFAYWRTNAASTVDNVNVALNNDTTAANYDKNRLQVTTSTSTGEGLGNRELTIAAGASSPANHFAAIEATIVNYASTSGFKMVKASATSWANRATGLIVLRESMVGWANTAAISRITLTPVTGTAFVAGSVVSLYGIVSAA